MTEQEAKVRELDREIIIKLWRLLRESQDDLDNAIDSRDPKASDDACDRYHEINRTFRDAMNAMAGLPAETYGDEKEMA